MPRSALFLSPHLDDVAFSCGAFLIRLVREGWQVCLCTVFTASVPEPTGFALACQLDKGIGPEVDYMAIRRAEDQDFAALADVREVVHLPFCEAPHRSYESATDLFAGLREGDEVWRNIIPELRGMAASRDAIFAPAGIGNHADHLQLIRAVVESGIAPETIWYRDMPYAYRHREAPPSNLLPSGLTPLSMPQGGELEGKLTACASYRTQLGFQFGGIEAMREVLSFPEGLLKGPAPSTEKI